MISVCSYHPEGNDREEPLPVGQVLLGLRKLASAMEAGVGGHT